MNSHVNQLKLNWQASEKFAELHFNGKDKVSKSLKAEAQLEADERFLKYKDAKRSSNGK